MLIAYISQYITLEKNDLIITGSPPGMGPVHPGDTIEGGIENLVSIKYCVSN
jgi:2-keto-4-pentenoate hydratase/2-oxohepta-3-ene-1,7-dioic acid hydratase in catechol pathway